MYDRPVPAGLGTIEDWLLQYIYAHPNAKHSTVSLLQQLDQVLRDEPSRLKECNEIRKLLGAAPLSAEEYANERKPQRSGVQRAVETLVAEGWANGKRNSDGEGVFFEDLKLKPKGEREAVIRARAKEKREAPPRSFESTIRQIHERKRIEAKEEIADDTKPSGQ
jgi:hypothetical protein